MTRKTKLNVLLLTTIVLVTVVFCLPRIPQSLEYHNFADKRPLWRIPNAANVLSNLIFLWTGALGLWYLSRVQATPGVKLVNGVLFGALMCVTVGSAYYHWQPDNDRLVFDRLPMTIVFMTLLAAILMEFISQDLGKLLFVPLVFVGIASIWWWQHTESEGHGDLRPYGLVQFYPMICIPMVIALFYRPVFRKPVHALIFAFGWYAIAKVAETFDAQIYQYLRIGGHALKHLAAGISTYYLVQYFRRRYFQKT